MNKWNRCMRLYNENHLLVFVSSVTENLRALRQEIKKAITEFPVTEPWLFEDMPASTESPSDLYLRKVKEADLVIWLVGDETTQPVADEIHTCMIAGVRLLAFLLCMDNRCQTTRNLIEKAQKYAKWEEVKESDLLAEYVTRALHDEIIRGYRNPDPPKRRRRLKQKFNFSLAQIKQSWISLGVSETVAANLSEDPTVGLDLGDLGPGLHIVKGDQGSGKSLAAARHFQKSVKLALDDISSPYPLFVNARDLTSNLVEYIDQRANEDLFQPEQGLTVVVDGVDEVGIRNANLVMRDAAVLTEANRETTVILVGRSLPGVEPENYNKIEIPELSDQQAIDLITQFSTQSFNPHHWHLWPEPIREAAKRPLFAVMMGTELYSGNDPNFLRPSQLIDRLAWRASDVSESLEERAYGLLKKLAVKAVSYGTRVRKSEVSSDLYDQKQIAESRLVDDKGNFVDFTLAFFREWFAARALIEGAVEIENILPVLDRWIMPLRIAMGSDDECLIKDLMTRVSTNDPCMAMLLLSEVGGYEWMTEAVEPLDLGTSIEAGQQILGAMEDWKVGLGNLYAVIGPTNREGEVSTLGILVSGTGITTSWYHGDDELPPIVDLAGQDRANVDWPVITWHARVPSHHAWSWKLTQMDLARALEKVLQGKEFPLKSRPAVSELAWMLSNSIKLQNDLGQMKSVIANCLHQNMRYENQIRPLYFWFGDAKVTFYELRLVDHYLAELSECGEKVIPDPWPSSEPLSLRSGWVWSNYSDHRLLDRTNAVYAAALDVYEELVVCWFHSCSQRLQLFRKLPVQLEGELSIRDGNSFEGQPILDWRTRVLPSGSESFASFVLEGGSSPSADRYWSEEAEAQKLLRPNGEEIGLSMSRGVLEVFGTRPATDLAYSWLASELREIEWQ